MSFMNRLANCKNIYQGRDKRVLCVCSAGLLRSPTIAWVLANDPYNFNTRSAGVSQEYALIQVDDVLVNWADVIVCASMEHADALPEAAKDKHIVVLNIPDTFKYKAPQMIALIQEKLKNVKFD